MHVPSVPVINLMSLSSNPLHPPPSFSCFVTQELDPTGEVSCCQLAAGAVWTVGVGEGQCRAAGERGAFFSPSHRLVFSAAASRSASRSRHPRSQHSGFLAVHTALGSSTGAVLLPLLSPRCRQCVPVAPEQNSPWVGGGGGSEASLPPTQALYSELLGKLFCSLRLCLLTLSPLGVLLDSLHSSPPFL